MPIHKCRFPVVIYILVCALGAAELNADGREIPQDVRSNIDARIAAKCSPAYVVGLVDADGVTWCCRGTMAYDSDEKVSPQTVFEIGSITKAFTGILLAESAARGKLDVNDPIDKYLPDGVTAPAQGERRITLLDLAQHRSGLPRLPTNFAEGSDPNDPYAHYDEDRLLAFLKGHKLRRAPGEAYEYSNLGAGLLGYLIGRACDKPYEELIETRICRVLGMGDTRFKLNGDQKKRLAPGHDGPRRTSSWEHFGTMVAAGGLRSTGHDMAHFVGVNLGFRESKLAHALAKATELRADTQSPGMQIALGWHISSDKGTEIIWHNGGTGGYRSFCGFAPSKKLGVVVLTNSSEGADDIGLHLLEPTYELKAPPVLTKVDASVLAAYVGKYELAPGVIMDITRDGDFLFAQLTGQPAIPVYPKSNTEFVCRVVDARLTFDRDEAGNVTSVTLHQHGRDMPAKRLGSDYVPPPEHTAVEVPVEVLKRYVGRYELRPGIVFDVALDGKQLSVQLTGQDRYPVYAESQTRFFYKVVDAQLTFVAAADGRAMSLVLHQFGVDQTAKRVED